LRLWLPDLAFVFVSAETEDGVAVAVAAERLDLAEVDLWFFLLLAL
jgi:hypothetical protein